MITANLISCSSDDIDVTSVTLDETSLTLYVDDQFTLMPTVAPNDATDKTVTWSSSDNSVVSVSSGVLKALKVGTATISASAQGRTGSCEVTVSPDIYVVGYESNGTKYVAKVWKNGIETDITDGTIDADASSVFVSGDDVYVAGHESNGTKHVAKLWKNDTETNLSDGTNTACANSVFVSGDDVYVAGYEYSGTNYVAKLWKNGTATNLSDGTKEAYANSIFVKQR